MLADTVGDGRAGCNGDEHAADGHRGLLDPNTVKGCTSPRLRSTFIGVARVRLRSGTVIRLCIRRAWGMPFGMQVEPLARR